MEAEIGSNNTAELQAILEALDYIYVNRDLFKLGLIIYSDSDYSISVALGLSCPKTNVRLSRKLALHFHYVSRSVPIKLLKG